MLTTLERLNPIRNILRNPVALKELRGRMRGARAFVVLTIYLGLIIFFMALAYTTQVLEASVVDGTLDGGEVGRILFGVIVYVELFLVMFITPTVTTNAISGEYERQTYDLLKTTLLPEHMLIIGKLVSALAYIFLLLMATIPLQGLALVFGGVSLEEIIVMQLTLTVTALLFGMLGIFYSATTRRTLRANMLTYSSMLAVIFIPFILLLIFFPFDSVSGGDSLGYVIGGGSILAMNPFLSMFTTQQLMQEQQRIFLFDYTLPNGTTTTLPMPWVVFTVFYLIATALVFMLTARRLRQIDLV